MARDLAAFLGKLRNGGFEGARRDDAVLSAYKIESTAAKLDGIITDASRRLFR